jgi:hypothetical protein
VASLIFCVSVLSKTTKDALIRPLWSHVPTPEIARDFPVIFDRKGLIGKNFNFPQMDVKANWGSNETRFVPVATMEVPQVS